MAFETYHMELKQVQVYKKAPVPSFFEMISKVKKKHLKMGDPST